MKKSILLFTPLACVAASALAQTPVKPIVIKTLPLVGGDCVRRTGSLNAAAAKAAIIRSNLVLKNKPNLIVSVLAPMPGIARVNNGMNGVFEPGGAYDITGRGFGTRKPSVYLRLSRRIVALDVASWTDQRVVVSVPGDVSGLDDTARVELTVAPPGQDGFTSTRFGFRAAREDVDVPVNASMLNGQGIGSTRIQDGFFEVYRRVFDSGGVKRCFEPGSDSIMPPLKPGFEVSGYIWYHEGEQLKKIGGMSYTPRGRYDIAYEGNGVRISYGVMRRYSPGNPLVFDGTDSGCSSHYRLKLIATGPRGRSPL